MSDLTQNFVKSLESATASAKKLFYHCYFCPSLACLNSANPQPASVHQRGVTVSTDKPRTDVKCPGCGGNMVIARNGLTDEIDKKSGKPTGAKIPHADGHITDDKEGNAVLHGDPIIQEAGPGSVDMTADLDAEAKAGQ